MVEPNLIRRDSSTQHRSNELGVHIIRQDGQIIRIQSDILLKTTIFMMKMIRALSAVLLCTSQTELASSTDSTQESDSNQATELHAFAAVGTQFDDTADAFVATDVWEFDVCDGGSLGTCGGAGFSMQVYSKKALSVVRSRTI
jgi:hypothetical protein